VASAWRWRGVASAWLGRGVGMSSAWRRRCVAVERRRGVGVASAWRRACQARGPAKRATAGSPAFNPSPETPRWHARQHMWHVAPGNWLRLEGIQSLLSLPANEPQAERSLTSNVPKSRCPAFSPKPETRNPNPKSKILNLNYKKHQTLNPNPKPETLTRNIKP
jgi:hypothetical protein